MNDRTAALLESRAVPIGQAFDLLAAYGPPAGVFFERRGRGVSGAGPTAWPMITSEASGPGDLTHVVDVLRSSVRRGREVAPVAIGAIGFARGTMRSHGLVIPRRTVRRNHRGQTWRLDTGHTGSADDAPPFAHVVGADPHEAFAEIQLREVPSSEAYAKAVGTAVRRIRSGGMRKVVLARTIHVDSGRELDPRLLAHRLRAVDPDAYTFAAPTDEGVIVGASPELLVSRTGLEVRSNPLAGSAPRSGDPEEDRASAGTLLSSAKNREEHAIVVEAVAETLGGFCAELRWDPEPVLRETPNVWHLSTRFRGVLRDPVVTAVDLVAELHPTPAVAGTPTDVALGAIREFEPFDRGSYAGPVGWVDADGDGEWAIALRCADLRRDRAVLYAGAGIVADSDPQQELDETERKFRAFLDALRWG